MLSHNHAALPCKFKNQKAPYDSKGYRHAHTHQDKADNVMYSIPMLREYVSRERVHLQDLLLLGSVATC